MARAVESTGCNAWVIGGDARVAGIDPCNCFEQGQCLKDLLKERRIGNVAVISGTCLADTNEDIQDPGDATSLIRELRDKRNELPGINAVLDGFLEGEI